MNVLVRTAIGFIGGAAGLVETLSETIATALRVDNKGALWTRDYQVQPAQGGKTITPSDSADHGLTFRALRFDGAGTVKYDMVWTDGTKASGVTRNVQAGEVWSFSSAMVTRIYATGTTATGIDALG